MKSPVSASNLFDRLNELHAILQTFQRDVDCLHRKTYVEAPAEIDSELSGTHRSYVRAVFALIEGVLDQHKQLILCLHDQGEISLTPNLLAELSEEEGFLSLTDKLKAIANAYKLAFKPSFELTVGSVGWEQFREAIKLRNRITHPKSFLESGIQSWDLEVVQKAEEWFRGFHNSLIRAIRTRDKSELERQT